MAVAVEMEFRGMTIDQYDQILEKAGLTPRGPTPPDALFHWVAESPDGLHIVDVWDSREAFDNYARDYIGPYSAEVGFTGQPEMHFHEVHNHLGRGL